MAVTFSTADYKSSSGATHSGAIAGIIISGLFSFAAIFTLLCRKKIASVVLILFSLIVLATGVG